MSDQPPRPADAEARPRGERTGPDARDVDDGERHRADPHGAPPDDADPHGADPGAAHPELLRPSRRIEFPCDQCGARMVWDPDRDALFCEHCEHSRPVPPLDAGTILERPLAEAGTAARGLGLTLRAVRCGNCGAQVALDVAEIARDCVYCGSSNVLAQDANRNAIRPESLLPLDVGRDAASEAFRRWLRGLWFRPSALKALRRAEAVGVYVPFWTFDCAVHSDWSAQAGYYYYVTVPKIVVVNGRPTTRMVRERRTRWEPAAGRRDDVFDDLLVSGSVGLSHELLDALGGFDTRALLPYRPEYLAGWRAEEYQVDLEQAWAQGQAKVEAIQRDRCAGDVPGDTHRFLEVRNAIRDVHWKHVLLPVWSLTYRFRDESYPVLVNGQTGRVVGKAPLSWVKIALAVLGVAAVVGVIAVTQG